MGTRVKVAGFCVGAGLIAAVIGFAASHGQFDVLMPRGTIASQQRTLMWWVFGLMLLVIIPVFALLVHIVWKYRASRTDDLAPVHRKALYTPDWDSNRKLEAIWWGFPTLIILILSIIIIQTSHSLDPFKPIASTKPPMTIQVISLQWKWLFIYPDENLATINYVRFPVDRPVDFQITSDAPMNSFWIPQLGGQVYAMTGMVTSLQLMANQPGDYRGLSANISGNGFAGMNFKATALGDDEYNAWVTDAKKSIQTLDNDTYRELARPSRLTTVATYQLADKQLQDIIVDKYASHGHAGGHNAKPESSNDPELEQIMNEESF